MANFNVPVGAQNWGLAAPGDSRLGVSLGWDLDAQFPAFALGPAKTTAGTDAANPYSPQIPMYLGM